MKTRNIKSFYDYIALALAVIVFFIIINIDIKTSWIALVGPLVLVGIAFVYVVITEIQDYKTRANKDIISDNEFEVSESLDNIIERLTGFQKSKVTASSPTFPNNSAGIPLLYQSTTNWPIQPLHPISEMQLNGFLTRTNNISGLSNVIDDILNKPYIEHTSSERSENV
jgi:hypothetical protein